MRVALKRQEVIAALIGPEGEAEMRLSRIPGGDLRKEPTLLIDAVKAIGFFPGPRVAFVEEATDVAAPAILAALEDWAEGDAQIVVTAQIDLVIRRIIVVIDVDILQIVIGQIAVGLVVLLLFLFLEGNWLLRLEHRLRRPFLTAFDAGDGIFLVQIVEAGAAVRARPLGAPFRFDHV